MNLAELDHPLAALSFVAPVLGAAPPASAQPTIPVRVVVVTTFENDQNGKDEGGEFQAWTDQFPLPEHTPFPQGNHELRYNKADQVLGIVTGEGTAHAAASITARGHDPRFRRFVYDLPDFLEALSAQMLSAAVAGLRLTAGAAL